MTTFEFDLSKSDSFIDGIQEIFKPPSVESSSSVRNISKCYIKSLQNSISSEINIKESNIDYDSENKNQFKNGNISWKKPKSNAHDFCDSCGTFEGERLVCDRCPSSFHLECLDPPIEIDEAPVGVWYCNRCTAIMKEEEDRSSSLSGQSKADGDNRGFNFSTKRSIQSTSSGSSEITTEMLTEDLPLKKRKSNDYNKKFKHLKAMKNLHDVIQCINPKEFELPKLFIPGIKLPSTFKTNAELKTKSVVSLENGIIPRPVVTCSECNRTCFYGSLLQCDYCPLYFHLDCLDPPLVQLPSRVERWMCPNHIEQVIDNSGLIKTIRLSERLNTYEEINNRISNIDEIDLLINFGLGRGFRFGSKIEEIFKNKPKIKVPDAVKRMYKVSLKIKTDAEEDNNFLSDEQKLTLKKIFQSSGKEIDINDTDIFTLFHNALDSLHVIIESRSLDLYPQSMSKSNVMSRPGAEQVKCRALFIPLNNDDNQKGLTAPIRMIYRNFDIGSGTDNDCVISGCKYVSSSHASISYIDNHFCFELINYSRYGTVVDDLLYYNDVSEKEYVKVPVNQNVKDIKNFIDTNNAGRSNRPLHTSMNSQRDTDKVSQSCVCTEFGYANLGLNNCTDQGWESTASLKFGSVVRIGCRKFLFTEMNENYVSTTLKLQSSYSSSTSSTDTRDSNKFVSKTNISPKSDVVSPSVDKVENDKMNILQPAENPDLVSKVEVDITKSLSNVK